MVERVKGLIPAQLQPRLLPKPASRYPADPRAVFVLSLCVLAGLPLLFVGAEPGSLEALLPRWATVLWAVALVAGAAATLGGMARQTMNGILAEQVGSVAVGGAALVYGATIAIVSAAENEPGGGFSAAIIIGWGVSCFWRWLQLQALVARGIAIVEEERSP